MKLPCQLALFFAATGLIATACGGGQVADPAGDRYAQAVLARDQGRLAEAERLITPSADQGSLQGALLLAEIEILRGRHSKAAERLAPLAERHPEHSAIAGAFARALDGAGQSAAAIAAYVRRLALAPDDGGAARRLAELLLGAGQAKAASSVANEATIRHPKDAEMHALLARTLLVRGRLPLALESARHATKLAPNGAAGWLQLARSLTLAGELEAAVEAYRKLLKIDPQHSAGLAGLAGVHIEQRRWKTASLILERAVAVDPGGAANWNALAVCRSRLGQHDAAFAAVNTALRSAPGNRLLRRNRIEVLLEAGHTDSALAAAEELVQDNKARGQGGKDQPDDRDLLARAIIANTLAEIACRGGKNAASKVEAEIGLRLKAAGMALTSPDIAKIAAETLPQVRAARGRCRRPPPSGPPSGAAP